MKPKGSTSSIIHKLAITSYMRDPLRWNIRHDLKTDPEQLAKDAIHSDFRGPGGLNCKMLMQTLLEGEETVDAIPFLWTQYKSCIHLYRDYRQGSMQNGVPSKEIRQKRPEGYTNAAILNAQLGYGSFPDMASYSRWNASLRWQDCSRP